MKFHLLSEFGIEASPVQDMPHATQNSPHGYSHRSATIGFDLRRSPRRHKRSQCCDECKTDGHCYECGCVKRRQAEQHSLQIPRDRRRAAYPEHQPEDGQDDALAEHEAYYLRYCAPSAMRMPISRVRCVTA